MAMKTLSEMDRCLGFKLSVSKNYAGFERKMRNNLKKQLEKVGLELYKFNKGFFEFSAILRNPDNGRFVYVSIMDTRFYADRWYKQVLVRGMQNEKDYGGHGCFNNFREWREVGSFAKRISEDERYYGGKKKC